ncbi:MAG: DUF167 domain-containing protein [Dehalococcoidia bacterium]|nr:DUF167 domain-containing protein [Dehalococcoidia bacterium]
MPLARIAIQAHPGSKERRIDVRDGEAVHVFVTERAEGGKANEAVVALLADALGVAKTRVSITRGHGARRKLVAVDGLSTEQTLVKLKQSTVR